VPNPPERQGLARADQWTVLIHAGMYHTASKSYAASEAGVAFARAAELSEGDTELFAAKRGLWSHYLVLARLEEARQLAEDLRTLAARLPHSRFLVEAETARGVSYYYLGQPTRANEHLNASISTYRYEHDHISSRTSGHDPGVVASAYLTLVRWTLGYPDEARRIWERCMALADRVRHPFSKSLALYMGALLAQLLRNPTLAGRRAQELLHYANQQGSVLFVATGRFFNGLAKFEAARVGSAWPGAAEAGPAETRMALAVEEMQQALKDYYRTESMITRWVYLVFLAEALCVLQRAEAAGALLSEARDLITTLGDRRWESEWFRIQGDLLLTRAGDEAAATCYENALQIARQQTAKSLELRAATSYARLLAQQGDKVRAKELLAGIHGWFTEGRDTRDLIEAKTLLDSL
jgi:tetratricopeptide (TPR) repeat protein